jgi:hypothetical protein
MEYRDSTCRWSWAFTSALDCLAAMLSDYRQFQTKIGALLAARRLGTLDELPHSDFLFAVRDWITTRAKALTETSMLIQNAQH